MAFITITDHARERYLIRSKKQFIHLSKCKIGDQKCEACKKVGTEVSFYIHENKRQIDREILLSTDNASEEKSLFNDHMFMNNWHEQYGYDCTPKFLVDDRLVYIFIQEKGKTKLVTCIDSKTHVAARRNKGKLNKKKKANG